MSILKGMNSRDITKIEIFDPFWSIFQKALEFNPSTWGSTQLLLGVWEAFQSLENHLMAS